MILRKKPNCKDAAMKEALQQNNKRTRKRVKKESHVEMSPDLLLQLYELLEGERDTVRVYSRALQSELCFVNPALCDPEQLKLQSDCPVYTTRELAFVLSLTEEEFRRFHYLKTKLVG